MLRLSGSRATAPSGSRVTTAFGQKRIFDYARIGQLSQMGQSKIWPKLGHFNVGWRT
jgi:hypothetical protein